MNAVPKLDFGGGHPDPNLTISFKWHPQFTPSLLFLDFIYYAKELVDDVRRKKIHLGAASDGDGDRNMIISWNTFVNPSDSIAGFYIFHLIFYSDRRFRHQRDSILQEIWLERIGAFNANFLCHWSVVSMRLLIFKGWKEDECSSLRGPDRLEVFWKLDGCWAIVIMWWRKFWHRLWSHSRKRRHLGSSWLHFILADWALAWLSIIVYQSQCLDSLVTVSSILDQHYSEYGRNFFTRYFFNWLICDERYDYEDIDAAKADTMMAHLSNLLDPKTWHQLDCLNGEFQLSKADNFSYTDPIDGSVSRNQGLRFIFTSGSRLVFRLSGTGTENATIRMYCEFYTEDKSIMKQETQAAMKSLVDFGLGLSKLFEFTGVSTPTVIT